MMDWRKIRYTPVEDKKGKLVGLVTIRILLRHCIHRGREENGRDTTSVQEIMIKDPISIGPDATIRDAMDLMRKQQIGCLPVVKKGELIGIITEMDFLRISGRLFERIEGE
jgi:CBS domain-containing protein